MATKSNPFLGPWRIVEMELWELEDIEMLGRGYIRFNRDGTGEFRFIAVQGGMDCRVTERDGGPVVEFSWAGYGEMDHLGDDSAFTAMRERAARKPRAHRALALE